MESGFSGVVLVSASPIVLDKIMENKMEHNKRELIPGICF